MDTSWKQTVKEYLEEVNQAYMNGNITRLARFYGDDVLGRRDAECWIRAYAHYEQRGILPRATKTAVIPLHTAFIGQNSVEITICLHHQLDYLLKETAYRQENRRIQKILLRKDGNEWLIWPRKWFTEKEDIPAKELATINTDENAQEVVAYRSYNREKAVAYAEQYWNSYNPVFPHFEVDCTNFISQCLYFGGIQMTTPGNRNAGWWIKRGANSVWSYSWAVANSLYHTMRTGKAPFYAKMMQSPDELELGDVICYDFDGDGRWQHNTIIVAKDQNVMPLVNAHTTNSKQRYWEYLDSTAYTPKIKYAFFHIMGNTRSTV